MKRIQLIGTFVLCITLTLVVISTASSASINDEIHLTIFKVDWPYDSEIHDEYDYTSFRFDLSIEIWNPGLTKYVSTPHSCLFEYNVVIDLDGFYEEISDAGMCACVVTTHTIESGITNKTGFTGFRLFEYLTEDLPFGEITIWVEFDSSSVQYDVFSYNTTIIHNSTGFFFSYPDNQDSGLYTTVNLIPLHSLILPIICALILKHRNKKLSHS